MKTLFSVLLGLLVAASSLAGTSFESFCDFKFGAAYHKDNGKHTIFQEMLDSPVGKFNQCQIRLNSKRKICEIELRARRATVIETRTRTHAEMNKMQKFEEFVLRSELIETFPQLFSGLSFDRDRPSGSEFTGRVEWVIDYRDGRRAHRKNGYSGYYKYEPSRKFPTRRDRGNDVYWLGKIIERGEDGEEKKTKLVRLAANSAYLAVTVTDMKLAAETAKKKR